MDGVCLHPWTSERAKTLLRTRTRRLSPGGPTARIRTVAFRRKAPTCHEPVASAFKRKAQTCHEPVASAFRRKAQTLSRTRSFRLQAEGADVYGGAGGKTRAAPALGAGGGAQGDRRAVRPLRRAAAAQESGEGLLVLAAHREHARARVLGRHERGAAHAAGLLALGSLVFHRHRHIGHPPIVAGSFDGDGVKQRTDARRISSETNSWTPAGRTRRRSRGTDRR